MPISAERYMALRTLYFELRKEWEEMSEIIDLRPGLRWSLDRSQGILNRLTAGDDILCRECNEGIEVKRLRALPFTRVCDKCRRERDARAQVKRAVRLHHQRYSLFR